MEPSERAPHCENACLVNVEALDLGDRRCAERPVQRALANLHREAYSLVGGELFGIVNARDRAHVRGHDDSAGDDRAGQGATPDFVDSGDEWPVQGTELLLDSRPPFVAVAVLLALGRDYRRRAFGARRGISFRAHSANLIALKLQRRRRTGKSPLGLAARNVNADFALTNPRGLAGEVPEVVELGSAHATSATYR